MLSVIAVAFIRYNSKIVRLKYLFAHHRLHEQIGLEINSGNGLYTHLPTNEHSHSNRLLDDMLADETELSMQAMTMNDVPHRTDELVDDPFYVDEKQPIFSSDRLNGRSNNTGIV